MTRNAFAIVYEAVEPGGFKYEKGLFACTTRGATLFLGAVPRRGEPEKEGGGVTHVVLAGPFAAYERFRFGPFDEDSTVVVRNLRTARVVREAPTGTEHVPGSLGIGPIVAVVLKGNGSVAWIAQDEHRSTFAPSGAPTSRYFDVYALDQTGERLLAAGTGIAPQSLALGGSFLYWTNAGVPGSTMLD